MPLTLYDISVASFRQTLEAVAGFLDKTAAYSKTAWMDLDRIVDARFRRDQHPFRYQVQSVALHSQGALEAMTSGKMFFWTERPEHDFDALQALIADARAAMERVTPDEINALAGGEVTFEAADVSRAFSTEAYVLSFALPNLHTHAATAYDLLRWKGVPLGPHDVIGPLRLKR